MKGVLPWLVCWAHLAGTRDNYCSALGSSQPSTKYFLLTVHYFTSFVPIAKQDGQAVVSNHMSLNVSLVKMFSGTRTSTVFNYQQLELPVACS